MKHRTTWLWAALAVGVSLATSGPAVAQPAPNTGMPPLIDRELFFGDPEIAGGQISPDGKYVSFLKPFNGTRNVWVKKIDEPFESARPITADTKRPISGYFWSRDSKFILFVQDQGGDENYNVYAVNPADPPAAGSQVPPARNLTEAKGARALIVAVPRSTPSLLYVALNDRDKAWFDLYTVDIGTGARQLVRKNEDRLTGFLLDTKDQFRLATRSAENGDTEILRADADGFKKIYSCHVFETCAPVRFHKDGKRVYLLSNKGEGNDLIGLRLLDVATGAEEVVETDPLKRVDLQNAYFSDLTDELVATIYTDEKTRIYFKDKAFEADYNILQKQFPTRQITPQSSTADEQVWLFATNSDTEPGETYVFDRHTKKADLLYRLREKLPRESLAPMTAVKYPSSDGLEIPAYLTLPKVADAKNLPAVIVPHGGPWARDDWGYDSIAQFLANRGYAVLQPNFRGSTGYGKKFLDAGNRQWGDKMQDDITWGVKYLVSKGIANPKRVGILGGSYGGYATLAALTFTPDTYAAGVSIVGPSNLLTLLESIPPYWEPIRKLFHERMGDPNTPEGKAQLERQSPLTHAAKIATPLLVIQGANDPRVKKAESDQIVVALRDRGFAVEYLVAPDEGHGFARPVNSMAMFAASEKFLAKHLGGRFQESMTPEVETRLKEITVDPKTVTMPKRMDTSKVTTPTPATPLTPGTTNYKLTMDRGGQKMEMAVTTEVKDTGGSWVVIDTMKSPMGDARDETTLAKDTLVVQKRSIVQGPVAIDINVGEGKVAGELKMQGQAKPIDVALEGELFADGAGTALVIATLPLAEGYATAFRNFDLQSAKVNVVELKVVGSEQVTVPAGTFDTFKVEVSNPDHGSTTTYWVAKDPKKTVKASVASPRLQGATLTQELQ